MRTAGRIALGGYLAAIGVLLALIVAHLFDLDDILLEHKDKIEKLDDKVDKLNHELDVAGDLIAAEMGQ